VDLTVSPANKKCFDDFEPREMHCYLFESLLSSLRQFKALLNFEGMKHSKTLLNPIDYA